MIGASILVTLGLGALGGVVLLTWTSGGQAFVVERVLRRLEGNLNGEIVISGLRSPGLHRGARLLGLRILAPDGSPLLAVDSVGRRVLHSDNVEPRHCSYGSHTVGPSTRAYEGCPGSAV